VTVVVVALFSQRSIGRDRLGEGLVLYEQPWVEICHDA
jgi:hypothetical protein